MSGCTVLGCGWEVVFLVCPCLPRLVRCWRPSLISIIIGGEATQGAQLRDNGLIYSPAEQVLAPETKTTSSLHSLGRAGRTDDECLPKRPRGQECVCVCCPLLTTFSLTPLLSLVLPIQYNISPLHQSSIFFLFSFSIDLSYGDAQRYRHNIKSASKILKLIVRTMCPANKVTTVMNMGYGRAAW